MSREYLNKGGDAEQKNVFSTIVAKASIFDTKLHVLSFAHTRTYLHVNVGLHVFFLMQFLGSLYCLICEKSPYEYMHSLARLDGPNENQHGDI